MFKSFDVLSDVFKANHAVLALDFSGSALHHLAHELVLFRIPCSDTAAFRDDVGCMCACVCVLLPGFCCIVSIWGVHIAKACCKIKWINATYTTERFFELNFVALL